MHGDRPQQAPGQVGVVVQQQAGQDGLLTPMLPSLPSLPPVDTLPQNELPHWGWEDLGEIMCPTPCPVGLWGATADLVYGPPGISKCHVHSQSREPPQVAGQVCQGVCGWVGV